MLLVYRLRPGERLEPILPTPAKVCAPTCKDSCYDVAVPRRRHTTHPWFAMPVLLHAAVGG